MLSTIIANNIETNESQVHLFHVSHITYLVTTIILSITTLLAIPANIIVIMVILKTPMLRSKAVNLLIVNLCAIDLVSTWLDVPLMWTILQLNYNLIHPSTILCKCQVFFHALTSSGQSLAFVSVGYERYHSIANPFDKEKTRYITHISIVFCWLIATSIAFIQFFIVPDTITYEFCASSAGHTQHRAMSYIIAPYGMICFILIAFFYSRIVWLVRKHCKTTNTTFRSTSTANHLMTDQSTQSVQTPTSDMPSALPSIYGEVCVMDTKNRSIGKRRIEAETAKRSLYVIATFTIICLPYPLLVCVQRIADSNYYSTLYQWQYCAHTMSSLSAGLNPLLYGVANKQFRSAFCRITRLYYKRYKDGVLMQ